MMQVFLRGLVFRFKSFRMVVCIRENMTSFFKLQSMLLIKESHMGASTSTHTDSKMLYTKADLPCGRDVRDWLARNGGGRQEQNQRHNRNTNSFGPSKSKRSQAVPEVD